MSQDRFATIRKINLEALVDKYGSAATLAKAAGYASASRISHIRGGKPMREESARNLEAALGLESGWLDRDHLPTGQTARAEEDLQVRITKELSKYPSTSHLGMEKLINLYGIIVTMANATGMVDPKLIASLVKLTE